MQNNLINRSSVFSTPIMVIIASLVAISYLGGLIGLDIIITLSFAFSIMLVLGLAILDICVRKRVDPWLLIILAFMILSIAYGELKADFDYYKSFLITLCTFICISYAPRIRMEEWGRKIIACVFFIMALITLVMFYFMGYDEVYYGATQFIAFNFDNPNAAALWILGILIINGCSLFKQKWYMKIVYVLVLIGLMHIIFKTESRNSLVSAMIFLGVAVLYQFIKNVKMPRWVLFLAVTAPIIVFFVYMYAITPIFDDISSMLGILKGTGDREKIWRSVIEQTKDSWVLGRYDYYRGSNLHNSMLTLLGMYGLPLTISACILMYRSAILQQEYISPLAALAFCSLMISGCFEASVFVGVGGFYLVILIIPVCLATANATD